MSLTKEDLQKFRGVVKEEIDQAIETKVRPIVQEEVEKGVEFLARITKKEFDIVHSEINGIKVDIANHDFKVTEQRVRRLEEKAGIRREK